MTSVWITIGGSLFAILGLVHAVYTLADISRPRRLVPDDPAVIAAMSSSGVRLARGGTTMWRAWVGFNFSHSLGVAKCLVSVVLLSGYPCSRWRCRRQRCLCPPQLVSSTSYLQFAIGFAPLQSALPREHCASSLAGCCTECAPA